MTPAPVLTFCKEALGRSAVRLGPDRIGEIVNYRGGRAEYSLQLGETVRRRARTESLDIARDIVVVLVNDTLQRLGCLPRESRIDVVIEGERPGFAPGAVNRVFFNPPKYRKP